LRLQRRRSKKFLQARHASHETVSTKKQKRTSLEYLSVFPSFNNFPAISTWKKELRAGTIGGVTTVNGRYSRNAATEDGIFW
jgi:hypothetical protein